ncbi:glutathione S-transferase N-terminal domain-containing protein [Kingella potus]|uniref:glutathione S-transferase N-terminal domain-containing protein n=1 Tax=Kingella potus TaxID=265175 RepID=UPI001FD4874D|nr:glutathione S-transferase N-terminal domain-containing protein [Kingella potus]UOP00923.1 glutathione S-transferase N-terminal domain-containing protein [Kingella potus]
MVAAVPWLLMKVLRIPFAEALHHFIGDKTEQRRQWRAFSPSAQVPALANGGETVWDSLAIAEYLAERHPQVWPQDAAARAWARCAAAEMHSGFPVLRTVCNFTLQAAEPPCDTLGLQRELARLDALWNEGLERFGGGFLAGGGFCAADAFYAPVVLRLRCYGLAGRLNGAVRAIRRTHFRPARAATMDFRRPGRNPKRKIRLICLKTKEAI